MDIRVNENDLHREDPSPVSNKRPGFDPEVQKAQGYLRALGIEEVDVVGKKKPLLVDGKIGPVTNAALAKYRADNGLNKEEGFGTVLQHMEGRVKQNPAQLQQFIGETNAEGPVANPMNVMAMQLVMNLLAPIIKALSGGKIDTETLKVDGINGPRTHSALDAYYETQMNKQPTAPVLKAAAPQAAPEAAKPEAVKPAEVKPVGGKAEVSSADNADPLGAFAAQKVAESEARMAASPAEPAAPPQLQAVEPGRRPTLRVDGATYGEDSAPTRRAQRYEGRPATTGAGYEFNRASGVEIRDRGLQQRAELRAIGYPEGAIRNILRDERTQELQEQGMDRRSAMSQARMESSMIDNVERQMRRGSQSYDRVLRQEDQHITQASRDIGRAVGVLSDSNPRNDHQGKGILLGMGVEAVLRGGVPGLEPGGARGGYGQNVNRAPNVYNGGYNGGYGGGFGGDGGRATGRVIAAEDRDITRISGDFRRAASVYMDSNPRNDHQGKAILAGVGVEAVLRGGIPGLGVGGARGGFGQAPSTNPISALMQAISGGNSRTYQAQPLARGAYDGYQRTAGTEWSDRQVRSEFDGAQSYAGMQNPRAALAPANRDQIIMADQPDPQVRAAEQRRWQDNYSP